MLRSLKINNFRCFQQLTVTPLERVNLIAGKNNLGKTSLLEAIFIFINPTNPEALFQVNRLRGIPGKGSFEAIEAMRGFFFDQERNKIIEISTVEEKDRARSLHIFLAESNSENNPEYTSVLDENIPGIFPANQSLTTEVRSYDRLVLEYQDKTDEKNISRVYWQAGYQGRETSFRKIRREKFPLGIYITSSTRSPKEDAERFSKLERVGRQAEVLETLRLLEPRLQRLSLLVVDGEPIIHGDLGMSELVPLPLMGEGVGRLLSIILAIAQAQCGTILIDEIENGLHYSVMTDVWKAIADAARRADAQIFATTHSQECIRAAHRAFDTRETYDFRYHRLELVKDEIQAVTYDRETLATSDEMDLEMR
ncbi:MAG: AAA family ATPase [Hormoscilla sp. GM7CHS1pb]|nr:AAA family ATPase [Hormoscilla sp. GM7CHS1pb]